jgi:transcriptional regulator with XRE-family HTH domain
VPEPDQEVLPESVQNKVHAIGAALTAAFNTDGPDREEAFAAARGYLDAAQGSVEGISRWRAAARGEEESFKFTNIVGRRLSEHRKRAGLTQATLAADMNRLGYLNWTRVTCAEVEGGTRKASLDELFAVAVLYSVPMAEFLLPDEWETLEHPHFGNIESSVARAMVTGPSDGPDWEPALLALGRSTSTEWRPAHHYWANRTKFAEHPDDTIAAGDKR